MKIALESIQPFVRLAAKEDTTVPLYNTQAELQLLSKLKSQSYKAYIGELAKLPEKDISTDLDTADIEIVREEIALPTSALLPTQREIYLDATLPKIKEDDVPRYFSKVVEIGEPIITFNNQFVIDGHHRWLSVAIINPRAMVSAINFKSEFLTPLQFLKLLQGAIVMENGELPAAAEKQFDVDIFHRSNKVIREYIDKTIPFKVLEDLEDQLKLDSTDRALDYLVQNALSIKYNNLPAVGSPSRELMPQTNGQDSVLDVVEDAPVMNPEEQ